MNPRSIQRSRLFWLGLPGLIFFLWLWLGTRDTIASVVVRSDHRLLHLLTNQGFLRLKWVAMDPGTPPITGDRLESARATTAITAPLFPTPLTSSAVDYTRWHLGNVTVYTLSLTHWLLLFTYLTLWATACAAWQYHKHRQHRIAHPPHIG